MYWSNRPQVMEGPAPSTKRKKHTAQAVSQASWKEVAGPQGTRCIMAAMSSSSFFRTGSFSCWALRAQAADRRSPQSRMASSTSIMPL